MNKNILKNRKAILSVASVVIVTTSAFTQGSGIAGVNEAIFIAGFHFDLGTELIYAISTVVGLAGDVKMYGESSSGDSDISKTAAS